MSMALVFFVFNGDVAGNTVDDPNFDGYVDRDDAFNSIQYSQSGTPGYINVCVISSGNRNGYGNVDGGVGGDGYGCWYWCGYIYVYIYVSSVLYYYYCLPLILLISWIL